MCFQPRTERFEWSVRVVPAGTTVARTDDAIFKALSSGRLTDAPAPEAIPLPTATGNTPAPLDDNAAIAKLARPAAISAATIFCSSFATPSRASRRVGCSTAVVRWPSC
jgi:hypothetical protein